MGADSLVHHKSFWGSGPAQADWDLHYFEVGETVRTWSADEALTCL